MCEPLGFRSEPPICTQATVHAVTTDAYVPGTSSGPLNSLLEWTYADDRVGPVDLAAGFYRGHGNGYSLPASADGGGGISLLSKYFYARADGVWEFASEGLAPDCDFGNLGNPYCGYFAEGRQGTWTRVPGVPAPSTLVLLGVGLAGLVFHRRRMLNASCP